MNPADSSRGMPEPEPFSEPDFDSQLRGLFEEAAQQINETKNTAGLFTKQDAAPKDAVRHSEERVLRAYASLPQMMRPMVLGLEAVTRATGENSQLLQKIEQNARESAEVQKPLPQLIESLQAMLENRNGVSQRMFDALHEELKGYKDGFLMESVQKPIIRDLISLYDDLNKIHLQMKDAAADMTRVPGQAAAIAATRMKTMETNLEHHCEFLIEILARLEVTMMPVGFGRLDKQTQRVVAIEIAEDPDEDMLVTKTLKRGFMWKDRVLRAEEVAMRKWKEGYLHALSTTNQTTPAAPAK
ncbi:MAG: grpE 2 [Chthoniobacter sp.]|nr:grpE 2 [Chthoniobacter sp.]